MILKLNINKEGFNEDACNEKNICLENSGLTCGDKKKCQCTSPYSWNANENKCSSCVDGFELDNDGKTCGN
jgi:hypothetical protein